MNRAPAAMMTNRCAIVIGGSVAGICTARVLSDFYDRVIVIDRDAYPQGSEGRTGVPQSRHLHILLVRGRREMERLFPGFDAVMQARGALDMDFGADFAALRASGWAPREEMGIRMLVASRALIENTARDMLRRIPNVELLERHEVTGIVAPRRMPLRAAGVSLRSLRGAGASELAADLVVDAAGRSSKMPQWLETIGLKMPEETVVNGFGGYSSRWFKAPPQRPPQWWWKGAFVDVKLPDHPMGFVLFPLEGNRWIVTIGGVNKHYPPADEAAFMAVLRDGRSPIVAEALNMAEPISDIYAHRAMANRRRHFERWRGRLDNFVALGDSTCAFNPVYGQGMTTAMLSAEALGAILRRRGPGHPAIAKEFFKELALVQNGPWSMAAGADLALPGTMGHRSLGHRMFSPITRMVFEVGFDEAFVRRRMGEVIHMLRPPADLMSMDVLWRAGRAALRRAVRGRAQEAAIPAMPPAQDASPLSV